MNAETMSRSQHTLSPAADVPLGPPRAWLDEGRRAAFYRNYVISIVWLVLLFRFIDIQIVAVLLESIKAEFQVSDLQLGLLSGTGFALFYGVLGIPVAWLADRYNRRDIIASCLALWSAATVVCGFAGSFASLFASRIAVGVGEAGGAPPAYSLVSDITPANRRSTVFAILNSAVPLGVFVGFLIGGIINATYGWRAAFIVAGAAGVAVALLFKLTVKEPRRGASEAAATVVAPTSIRESLRFLWSRRSYRHLVLASSIFTLGAVGSGMWIASFFVRVHGMTQLEVAAWLAFIYGGGGVVGAVAGGYVADRLSRRDQRWQAWLPSICTAAILPFSLFVYLWPVPTVALLVHTGTTILMHSWMGPTYGTIQSLAGPSRRAMAAAINLLVLNVLALGAGPLIVGALSDQMSTRFGSESIRYSILLMVSICYSWAAVHFCLAARTLKRELNQD